MKPSCCIYRHAGEPPTCGEDKEPCRWWRAAICIPLDMVKFAGGAIGKMLLKFED